MHRSSLSMTRLTAVSARRRSPLARRPLAGAATAAAALGAAGHIPSGTRLVVQTVTVKDKDGKPIEGLTAKDFVVTEDDEPQEIAFVEFQRLAGRPGIAPPHAARGPSVGR